MDCWISYAGRDSSEFVEKLDKYLSDRGLNILRYRKRGEVSSDDVTPQLQSRINPEQLDVDVAGDFF